MSTIGKLKKPGIIAEFQEFLNKYGVIGLAIAFIIGAAATALVQAVVADVLMPIIGLLLPGGDWQNARFIYPALPAGVDVKDAPKGTLVIAWGHLLNALIYFLIVAAFVFVVAKVVLKESSVAKK